MKSVIGITGPRRAGKTTVQEIICQELLKINKTVKKITFSDVLADICRISAQPLTRENLIGVVAKLKELWGKDWLVKAIEKRVMENSDADVILLAGLRWFAEDYPFLKSLPNSRLIYVDAPEKVRWQRASDEKPDEAQMTFEEFMLVEFAITEVEIPKFKKFSDLIINNEDISLEHLLWIVLEFLKEIRL